MKFFIEEVIRQFGPREAGSMAEKSAQRWLSEQWQVIAHHVSLESFPVALQAKFGSLRMFAIFYALSLLGYWMNPLLALWMGVVTAILFLGHFVTYRNWLDFLFPQDSSYNVAAMIKPTLAPKLTVILSAHMDSAREFRWWYQFKEKGLLMNLIGGISIILYPLFLLLFFILNLDFLYLWWFFLLLSPTVYTLYTIHGSLVVPGAQDNLSGLAIVHELGRRFGKQSRHPLKNIRLILLSCGAEEIGLRGSAAFAKAHKDWLQNNSIVVVNLDGIKDENEFKILYTEAMPSVTYPEFLINAVEKGFTHAGVSVEQRPLWMGGTDAASFQREGWPSVSIIAMSMDRLDPTYHTRLDQPKDVSEKALLQMTDILEERLRCWDDKGKIVE